jgi:outer membrane protein W
MKKGKMIWLAVLAALVLVPTMVWAQAQTTSSMAATEPSFFAELYAGGGGALNSGKALSSIHRTGLLPVSYNLPGNINPYVLGGVKLGYWFTPQGTYAASWYTDWMKYLGFYMDFNYNNLSFSDQRGTYNIGAAKGVVRGETIGSLATLAFMFSGRYGFLQDNEVPFGRLQPYIGVGPAIFFSSTKPTIWFPGGLAGRNFNPGYKSDVSIGLESELGLRYMFTKSISLELSFKYRYFAPSYNYSQTVLGQSWGIDSRPNFNLFSGQLGAAYHF